MVRCARVRLFLAILTGPLIVTPGAKLAAAPSAPVPTLAAVSPAVPVSGRVWIAAEKAELATELATRLWTAIENRQDEPITDVTFVDFDVPGFVRVGRCWDPLVARSWPSCPAESTTRSAAKSVAPQSTMVLWADVTRESPDPGRIVISGVFEWTDAKGRHRGQLNTAAIDLVNIRRPLDLPPAWLDFAKDMFLPVTVLLLGFLWQRVQQRRTDRRAVWATMLEKSRANAERYYMPIDSAIQTFVSLVGEVRKLVPPLQAEAFDEMTLWLLVLVKRHRVFLKKIGGYYFKNRIGESIASDCWDAIYFRTLKPMMTRALLDRVVEPIDAFETQAALAARCSVQAYADDYQAVRAHVMTWAGYDVAARRLNWDTAPLKLDLHVLKLWSIVLEVEMNRPEKLWYGDDSFAAVPTWTVTTEAPVSTQLDKEWVEVQELMPALADGWPAEKREEIERLGAVLEVYKQQLSD